MTQKTLEYHTPSAIDPFAGKKLAFRTMTCFGVVLLVANFFLCSAARADHSWGALGIAILIGPIANAVIGLVAGLATFLQRRTLGSHWVAVQSAVSICLPIASVAADWGYISTLSLHGC